MEKGATTLVTSGAAQSNHARLTAAAACRLGLGCWLVLRGEPPPVRGTQPRLHGSHPAGRDPSAIVPNACVADAHRGCC
ncbi:MAG: hypothetical protein ACLPS1_10130 [Streptosporangiaceae bacterium]